MRRDYFGPATSSPSGSTEITGIYRMRNKSSLLCSVALGVAIAASLSAGAQAKTKKHHHSAAPAAAAADDRVSALADEIESLKARLDAETLAREQDETQLQAAQASAAQAQSDAAAAHAQLAEQVQTLPDEVKSDVKTEVAASTPKPGWWGDTTVGGLVFADASDIDQHSTSTAKSPALVPTSNGYGVDLKRFYMIIDHKFNDTFSADLTTDVTYDSTTKASQLYVKKAWLQAKLSDAFAVRLGASDMPWVPFMESLYGYRYVENVLIDRTKYGTSTDWGIHAFGKLPPVANLVTVSYAASVVNGAGYKVEGAGTTNRSQSADFEGRVSAQVWNITAGVGGYEGDLGKDVAGTAVYHTASRIDGVLAYVDPRVRLGAEYLYADDYNDVTTAPGKKTAKAEGGSVFGSFNFTPQIALFGRYDHLRPLERTDGAENEDYFNVGLGYTPVKNVDLALVWKRDAVYNDGIGTGLLTTANGAGTGAGSGSIGGIYGGAYNEVGLFTRYAW